MTHSFTTRRSSELMVQRPIGKKLEGLQRQPAAEQREHLHQCVHVGQCQQHHLRGRRRVGEFQRRSEEHTYELQSLMRISSAVFCLKNKTSKNNRKILNRHSSIKGQL